MTAVADAVALRLRDLGVDLVFGIPGTHNLELFRALTAAGIRIVDAHHEQGLGYAADGWSRVTGRPAAIVVTTGPGVTNALTALATSAAASVPVLAIAPGVPDAVNGRGTGWLHDLPDQWATVGSVVRAERARSAAEAVDFIDRVASSWRTGRRLPAYLEIPVDVLDDPGTGFPAGEEPSIEGTAASKGAEIAAAGVVVADAMQAALDSAVQALTSASRIAIVVGRGGCGPHAAAALGPLAELLNAPVLTTANAKGALDERHPLSLGVALRLSAGHELLRRADLVLVIGSDLGRSEFWGDNPLEGSRLIRIDIEPGQMVVNAAPAWPLLGDAEVLVPALRADLLRARPAAPSDAAPEPGLADWAAEAAQSMREQIRREGAAYEPYHRVMVEESPSDVVIAGDSSQATYYGSAYAWPLSRPNRFLYPAGYGTLGYAMPAAIGAALAGAAERVIAITGEGGLMFSIQELATAARLRLPIPVVVFVNGGYREIRNGMVARGIPPTGVDFVSPDLPGIARGLGAEGRHVRDLDEFRSAFREALRADGPYLVSVDLDESGSAQMS